MRNDRKVSTSGGRTRPFSGGFRRQLGVLGAAGALLAVGLVVAMDPPANAVAPLGDVATYTSDVSAPHGIVAGPDGNMWFTDFGNGSIDKITMTGAVTRYTGVGISNPAAIAVGADGNLWFTNFGSDSNSIGRITTAGVVSNFKGTGISQPYGITAGPDGAMWFTNYGNSSLGRITMAGSVTHFTDPTMSTPRGIVTGPDGNLWFTNPGNNSVGKMTTSGVVTQFTDSTFNSPFGITVGPDANLWFTNIENPGSIGRITPLGVVSNFPGTGVNPLSITTGSDGNLWFTNSQSASIGRITPLGVISTFSAPNMNGPHFIAAGPDGNLWFANVWNKSIGRSTTAGQIVTFFGNVVAGPQGIAAGSDGNLWYTNRLSNTIGRSTPNGSLATYTGAGVDQPVGIVAGPDGNLWFANYGSNSIGRVTTAGVISNFTDPGIVHPVGITTGGDGNLWFTIESNAMGRITPAGVVTIFPSADIGAVQQLAAGGDGNVWFIRTNGTPSIGRITPAGVVTRFANVDISAAAGIVGGPDGNIWFTNGGSKPIGRVSPSGAFTYFSPAGVSSPRAITVGQDGNLWFADDAGTLRRMTTSGEVTASTSIGFGGLATLTAGPDGNLWFAEPNRNGVGSIGSIGVGPPTPPLDVLASPGLERATVVWSAPASTGGPVTGYVVTASPGGQTCATTGALSCTVTGLTGGSAYTFTVRASNIIGFGLPSAPSTPVKPGYGTAYHPLVPARILDSRTFAPPAPLAAGSPEDLQVTGQGGVPGDASAVVMNVTVTDGSANSFVSVWPAGDPQPNVSNLNFAAGETIPNLVTIKLGSNGRISFANAAGTVHVVADVVGYYDDGLQAGGLFTGITPTRLLDSRTTNGGWNAKLAASAPRDLLVRQPQRPTGVPATATAVVANVTVTGGTDGSFLSVWPSGVDQPVSSNLNFGPGQTIPNLVVSQIGANGAVRIANAVGDVDVVVDIVGYFDPTTGARFHAITPTRVLDDRVGNGLTGPWGEGQTRVLPVAGRTGTNVPTGASGLVLNVTATNGTRGSFVTVFPSGVAKPNSSNLNFGSGQTIPNLVTVGLPPSGSISLFNQLGSVDLIADAVGYYAAT